MSEHPGETPPPWSPPGPPPPGPPQAGPPPPGPPPPGPPQAGEGPPVGPPQVGPPAGEPAWGAPQAGFGRPPAPPAAPVEPWVLAAGALGGLLTAVAAPLSWATGTVTLGGRVLHHSVGGLDSDLFGAETLVVGVLTLALTVAMGTGRLAGRPVTAGLAGLGFLIVVFALLAFNKISNTEEDTRRQLGRVGVSAGFDAGAGIGLWLTLAAGVLLIAGGLTSVLLGRQAAAPA